MNNFNELIVALKDKPFKITATAKGEQLHQTQRNELKKALLCALFDDIKADNEFTYMGKDGIMVEIANDSVADNIKNTLGSGAITCTIDIKINSLEFNADEERKSYEIDLQEKAEKKLKAEQKKADKIARDKSERQEKKGE